MEIQKELGVDITQEEIDACKKIKYNVSLESIKKREAILHHDLKARLEEFCELAGHQKIHLGLTSRDITDNVELITIHSSAQVLIEKTEKILEHLVDLSGKYDKTLLVARTHNVPAQPTSLGKRLASFGEPLLRTHKKLKEWNENLPLRGIKGAVGTNLDLSTLLPNGEQDVPKVEKYVIERLLFSHTFNNVGQVYPREVDFEFVSLVYNLTAPLASLATTFRLMAGEGLWSEGFQKGQVGSSAMPHKTNAINCERVCGLHDILGGYLAMCTRLAGSQWNEGDVSCSVVRRVALPGLCFAADGLLKTFLTILNGMSFDEEAIEQEFQRELPVMSSSTLLMEAVKRGEGREEMHKIIKGHILNSEGVDFIRELGEDDKFPMSPEEMKKIVRDKNWTGMAPKQVEEFIKKGKD